MEPFADPVRPGRFHPGLGVADVVDRHEELEVVLIDAPDALQSADIERVLAAQSPGGRFRSRRKLRRPVSSFPAPSGGGEL